MPSEIGSHQGHAYVNTLGQSPNFVVGETFLLDLQLGPSVREYLKSENTDVPVRLSETSLFTPSLLQPKLLPLEKQTVAGGSSEAVKCPSGSKTSLPPRPKKVQRRSSQRPRAIRLRRLRLQFPGGGGRLRELGGRERRPLRLFQE